MQSKCPQCGRDFNTKPYRLKTNPLTCCSVECGLAFRIRPASDRFWEKVNKSDGCWLWTASIYPKSGYGQFTDEHGKGITAHSFAWKLVFGEIPEGLDVCHTCDVRRCVRIDHLFLGTRLQNMQDAVAKGRIAHGESHGMAKITEGQVIEFRKRHKSGETVKQIALDSPLSLEATRAAIRGWNWSHIVALVLVSSIVSISTGLLAGSLSPHTIFS